MRFNPPPNWPPVPPGWAPDANWIPDPAWPPPPPGWQLWVDDAEGAAPYLPPGYPGPYLPYPPPPPPGSKKLLPIALASIVIVVALVVGLGVVFGGRILHPGAEKPSKKPDITELTADLLVDRSAFPEIAGGKWISGVNSAGGTQSTMPNLTTDPPECADLYGDAKSATQSATATLANLQAGGLHSTRVHLAITAEPRNLKDYLEQCRSFTQTFESSGRSGSTEVQLEPLDVDGVPPWAVATVLTSTSSNAIRLPMSVTAATISGYYRGVLVVASSNDIRLRAKNAGEVDPDNADALVALFNAQIERLEAAP